MVVLFCWFVKGTLRRYALDHRVKIALRAVKLTRTEDIQKKFYNPPFSTLDSHLRVYFIYGTFFLFPTPQGSYDRDRPLRVLSLLDGRKGT